MQLHESGYSVAAIMRRLEEELISMSHIAVYKLLKKHKQEGNVGDQARRLRSAKLSQEQLVFIDNAMVENDELSSRQLHQRLEDRWQGLWVSLQTVRRVRKHLGWVCTRPKYCQLIHEVNKLKCLEWSKARIEANEKFENVVSDEYTVQLDHHGRVCFRRKKGAQEVEATG